MAKRKRKAGCGVPFTLGDNPTSPAHALLTATPEHLRHAAHTVEVRDRMSTGTPLSYGVKVEDTCPLAAYLRRGKLTWRQHEAGAAVARAWQRAVIPRRMTARWEERVSGNGADTSPAVTGAHGLWRLLERAGLASPVREGATLNLPGTARGSAGARAPMRLTPGGTIVLSVCGMEEWAGGTRNLDKLRESLDALADVLRIPRP